MPIPTFPEYVAMREGVLSPTRPPLAGMTRLNALPTIDARRKRLHMPKPVKVPNPFKPVARMKPTVPHVTEIVPQSIIPKLKPPLAGLLPQRASQLMGRLIHFRWERNSAAKQSTGTTKATGVSTAASSSGNTSVRFERTSPEQVSTNPKVKVKAGIKNDKAAVTTAARRHKRPIAPSNSSACRIKSE
jgi:hypothetical protein